MEEGKRATKSERSNRTIKMDEQIRTIFKKLFAEKQENIYELVFFSPNSTKYKVYSNISVNKALKKMLKTLGMEQISILGLRHTHTSVLLYRGASIHYVSERLGHADIDVTNRIYSHMIKELRERDESIMLKTFEEMQIAS